jgi:hypothetical protein
VAHLPPEPAQVVPDDVLEVTFHGTTFDDAAHRIDRLMSGDEALDLRF